MKEIELKSNLKEYLSMNNIQYIFEKKLNTLLSSGALDLSKEEYGNYRLAKNVTHAILQSIVDDLKPLDTKESNKIILTTIMKTSKKYYIGKRCNPQLKNPYYIKYGQLSVKEAKLKEKCIYGSIHMTSYETENEYKKQIDYLLENNKRVC